MVAEADPPASMAAPDPWLFLGLGIMDWVQVAALVVAAGSLLWTGRSLNLQSRAHDLASHLMLTERFSDAWRKFRAAEPGDDRDYEFTEILNLIEGVCLLHNRGALHKSTREIMGDYLKEVIEHFHKNDYARERVKKTMSSETTYAEMRSFAEKRGIKWMIDGAALDEDGRS